MTPNDNCILPGVLVADSKVGVQRGGDGGDHHHGCLGAVGSDRTLASAVAAAASAK